MLFSILDFELNKEFIPKIWNWTPLMKHRL
jgi:hypothetical protein